MNQSIGDQLHAATDAFTPTDSGTTETRALNVCMAPGGYTWSLLQANPTASICGITLPPELGGHPAQSYITGSFQYNITRYRGYTRGRPNEVVIL